MKKSKPQLSSIDYRRICICGSFNANTCPNCQNYFISIYKTHSATIIDTHMIELIIYNYGIKEDIVINNKKISNKIKKQIQKLMVQDMCSYTDENGCYNWGDYEKD